jgi:hypothetical protein
VGMNLSRLLHLRGMVLSNRCVYILLLPRVNVIQSVAVQYPSIPVLRPARWQNMLRHRGRACICSSFFVRCCAASLRISELLVERGGSMRPLACSCELLQTRPVTELPTCYHFTWNGNFIVI